MASATETNRYTAIAIALHWVLALAITGMIAVGWYMSDLPNTAENKFALYQLHKSFGITILVLTLARIGWRLMNPPPPLPSDLKPWEKHLSHGVHIGFYALMILMPLSGWAWSSASATGVPTILFGVIEWPHIPGLSGLSAETKRDLGPVMHNVHSKLAWVAIALLVMHVGGALKHDFIDKEGAVLRRMIPGLFGKTRPPIQPARGVLPAFGGALAVFAAIAATPLLFSGSQASTPAAAATPNDIKANWVIDMDASEIKVVGLLMGYETPAFFPEWTGEIEFYPDEPARSAASVRLIASAATANDGYLDTTLMQEDWLGASEHPVIDVMVTNIREADEGWTADLAYTLKGNSYNATLPFTLDLTGDTARMTGALTVDRFEIGIGANADPDKEWIDTPLRVDIDVTANRRE